MAVNAGELRHRVIIQEYIKGGRDDDGYELPSQWTEYIKLWAKITPLSTKDLLSAQAADSEVTARMKVRYRTDIDSKTRIMHRGQMYAIDGDPLPDDHSGLEYITLMLKSVK